MARELGFIEHGTGKHQSNIVWDIQSTAPSITTITGGGTQQIKILVRKMECLNIIINDRGFVNKDPQISKDICPTLRAQDHGNPPKVIMRKGAALADKEYVGIRQAVRGGYAICEVGGVADFLYPTSKLRRGRVQGGGQICPTITAENSGVCRVERRLNTNDRLLDEKELSKKIRNEEQIKENKYYEYLFGENGVYYPDENVTEGEDALKADWENCEYRIRKLTPMECFLLMDVEKENAEKMLAINSATQCYKEAGNSIVVSVLCAIFSQLNIKGVKPWNERTLKEKYDLVANPKAHIN